MSASQNPVIHPDENVLAAFAEQALTGAERESVLAHVSGCARCRDIVFLAQESAAQQETVQEVAVRPVRRRWLRWQSAAAGAWVLALVIGAALVWHRRENSPPRNQLALVRPAAPPAMKSSEKGSQAQPASAPATPVTPARQSRNGPMNEEMKAPEMRKKTTASREKSFVPAESESVTVAQSYIAPPAGAPEQQAAIATNELRSMPVPQNKAAPKQIDQATLQGAPAAAAPAPPPAPPPAPNAASNELAATNVPAVSRSRQLSAVSVNAESQQASVTPSLPQFTIRKGNLERLAAGGYRSLDLPAGTRARSVVSYANIVVVLTRQRTLYRSFDLGEHWLPVPAQWNGKPAELRLRTEAALSRLQKGREERRDYAADSLAAKTQAGVAGAIGSGAPHAAPQLAQPATKAASPPVPGVVFELTNSAGKRWLSRDGGQSWQPE